jgi:hypothetical protein
MSDNAPIKPIRQPIVIHKAQTTDGRKEKDLPDCFFLPTEIEGFFNFFDKHGRTLATGVSSGNSFPFLLDGHAWTIFDFTIDDLAAGGNWSNNADGPAPDIEQDGSFQASSSGGGAVEDDAVVEDDPPPGAIEIKTVTGGADKDKLKKCYFLADGSVYDFYSKNGVELASGLTSGNDFSFTHDSISWSITSFVINSTSASGNWTNPDEITNEQDGTFQASSSGGVDEETASAASAS